MMSVKIFVSPTYFSIGKRGKPPNNVPFLNPIADDIINICQ